MGEPISPIARALLGDSDEPDREISCTWCGQKTSVPGFIVAAVKTWNEQHRETDAPIKPSEMGIACPGACTSALFKQKHEEQQREDATTLGYLSMLFAGKYNPESIAWLRKRGFSRQVNRVLNEEGQKSHG